MGLQCLRQATRGNSFLATLGFASESLWDSDYLAEEFQQMYLSRKANPHPLGNCPLIVLGAGKRPQPPGTSDEQWKKLRQERDELAQDLVHLSRNSKFILAPNSGHAIHNKDPQLVARAVEEVLNRTGDRWRVRRGGAWTDDGWPCRSAFRLRFEPHRRYDHIGFRVVVVRS